MLLIKDFTPVDKYTKNPNGNWQYGYLLDIGGTLTLHRTPQPDDFPGIDRWQSTDIDSVISVMRNRTNKVVFPRPNHPKESWPTYTIPPNVLLLHPGETKTGQRAHDVVRWTCPRDGSYQVVGSFDGLDRFGDDTEVWVVIGNREGRKTMKAAIIDGYCRRLSIDGMEVDLWKNDVVDFIVGAGPRFGNDSVGLQVNIKQTKRR